MSQQLSELCKVLIEDIYGTLPSVIFSVLAARGRLNIRQIGHLSHLPPRHVKHGLALLVQHQLVNNYTSPDDDITYFEPYFRNAYNLVRSGKYAELAEEYYGEEAAAIVTELQSHGLISAHDLKDLLSTGVLSDPNPDSSGKDSVKISSDTNRGPPKPPSQDASGAKVNMLALQRLFESKHIVRARRIDFMPPHDFHEVIEDEILEEDYPAGPKGKQKVDLSRSVLKRKRNLRDDNQASIDLVDYSLQAPAAGGSSSVQVGNGDKDVVSELPRKQRRLNGGHGYGAQLGATNDLTEGGYDGDKDPKANSASDGQGLANDGVSPKSKRARNIPESPEVTTRPIKKAKVAEPPSTTQQEQAPSTRSAKARSRSRAQPYAEDEQSDRPKRNGVAPINLDGTDERHLDSGAADESSAVSNGEASLLAAKSSNRTARSSKRRKRDDTDDQAELLDSGRSAATAGADRQRKLGEINGSAHPQSLSEDKSRASDPHGEVENDDDSSPLIAAFRNAQDFSRARTQKAAEAEKALQDAYAAHADEAAKYGKALLAKKAARGEYVGDDPEILNEEAYFRLNYEKFDVSMRSQHLANVATRWLGEPTAKVYAALLRCYERKIPRCRDPFDEDMEQDNEDLDSTDDNLEDIHAVRLSEVDTELDPKLDLTWATDLEMETMEEFERQFWDMVTGMIGKESTKPVKEKASRASSKDRDGYGPTKSTEHDESHGPQEMGELSGFDEAAAPSAATNVEPASVQVGTEATVEKEAQNLPHDEEADNDSIEKGATELVKEKDTNDLSSKRKSGKPLDKKGSKSASKEMTNGIKNGPVNLTLDEDLKDGDPADLKPSAKEKPRTRILAQKASIEQSLPEQPLAQNELTENRPDDRPRRIREIEYHLELLAQHSHEFVDAIKANGEHLWRVDFQDLITGLIHYEFEDYMTTRYSRQCARIVQILNIHGKLDEKQLADMTLISQKYLRTYLAVLQRHNLVEWQEIPRDASRTPSRTIYLWYFDESKCRKQMVDDAYKVMTRLMQRIKVERRKVRTVLEKSQRTDVVGREDKYLSKTEKEALKEFRRKDGRIRLQVARLDNVIALLRDYLPTENL